MPRYLHFMIVPTSASPCACCLPVAFASSYHHVTGTLSLFPTTCQAVTHTSLTTQPCYLPIVHAYTPVPSQHSPTMCVILVAFPHTTDSNSTFLIFLPLACNFVLYPCHPSLPLYNLPLPSAALCYFHHLFSLCLPCSGGSAAVPALFTRCCPYSLLTTYLCGEDWFCFFGFLIRMLFFVLFILEFQEDCSLLPVVCLPACPPITLAFCYLAVPSLLPVPIHCPLLVPFPCPCPMYSALLPTCPLHVFTFSPIPTHAFPMPMLCLPVDCLPPSFSPYPCLPHTVTLPTQPSLVYATDCALPCFSACPATLLV